jgi:uncharacterized protein YdbL (DUF1318 family)
MKKFPGLTAMLLTACVTINIYFPAAAAEKVADQIIQDIQDTDKGKNQPDTQQKAPEPESRWRWLDRLVSVFIAPAHAGEANLSIDSAEIRQVRASMQGRFPALQPLYAAGYIGIQADGLLTVRDANAVPLAQRNQVSQLVAAENADRQKLYQAIANANGHPDWAGQIKSTFAARWIGNAQSGWWYQSGGAWKQK